MNVRFLPQKGLWYEIVTHTAVYAIDDSIFTAFHIQAGCHLSTLCACFPVSVESPAFLLILVYDDAQLRIDIPDLIHGVIKRYCTFFDFSVRTKNHGVWVICVTHI